MLLLGGCTHTLNFCVIDGTSGAPLPDVNVRVKDRGPVYYFESNPRERSIGTTPTVSSASAPVQCSGLLYCAWVFVKAKQISGPGGCSKVRNYRM